MAKLKKRCFNCKFYRDYPKQCRRKLDGFIYKNRDDICKQYEPDKTMELK